MGHEPGNTNWNPLDYAVDSDIMKCCWYFMGQWNLLISKGIYIHTYSDLNFPYGWILHYLPSRFLIKLAPGNRLLNRNEGSPNIFIWEKTTNHFKWTLKHVENLLECGKSSEHLSAVYLRVTEAEEAVNAFPSAHGLIYNCRNMYRSAEIFFILSSSFYLYSLDWIEVVPWWTIPRFCTSFPALPKGLRWLATHTSDMCLKNIKVHYLTSMLERQTE